MGSLLAWQYYRSVETAMLSAAGQAVQQLGKVLIERSRSLIEPPTNVLRVLSYSPIMQDRTQQQRLERLPQLVESLRANSVVSAAFIGYPTGEFFMVRKLVDPQLQTRFSAPAGAQFMVRSTSLAPDDSTVREWRFYDADTYLLEIREHPDSTFGPGLRPWFELEWQPPDVMRL